MQSTYLKKRKVLVPYFLLSFLEEEVVKKYLSS